ncbi:Outer membrane protein TolC [Thermodesulfobium acidiphilum]|uniref:Outer membrane protein TolC n=1 Tax=Thermodesulfobium acidiphilum TaxID=1794699 RepID=A0A2R4W0W1_THEAF|nr:TolC family protein [Thermodesulfobium acidiphilum]AWB10443.1 Outer membrane protein TolC [Thermodesulfobium acidiphilum]
MRIKINCFIFFILFFVFVSLTCVAQSKEEVLEYKPTNPPEELSLTLDKAIELAKNYSPLLKMDREKIGNARMQAHEISGYLVPHLNWQSTYTELKSAPAIMLPGIGKVPTGYKTTYDHRAVLTYEFDVWRKIWEQRSAAWLNVREAEENYRSAVQDLTYRVTKAYFQCLQAEDNVASQEADLKQIEEQLRVTQAMYNAGTAAKIDVLRVQVALAQIKQNLLDAKNQRDLAYSSLNNLIGYPMNTKLILAKDQDVPNITGSVDELTTKAVSFRPDLRAARFAAEAAKKLIWVAKTKRLPDFTITAYKEWVDNHFFPNNQDWGAVVEMTIPIYNGGIIRSQVQQAIIAYRTQEDYEKQIFDQVKLDVKQALLNLISAKQRIDTISKSVAEAEESLRLARVRYQAGVNTISEVLDAEAQLSTSQTQYAQAKFDYQVAKAALYKAIGLD